MFDQKSGAQAGRRRLLTAASASVASAAATAVFPRIAIGQAAWPSKPIKIILASAAGGLTDNVGRQYGDFLSQKFGQPVVVENRAGASGTIGTDVVAKAAPDGYTFLMTIATSVWHGRALYRNLPYKPDQDLTPVSLFPSGSLVLAVPEKIPARNAKEFVEYLRKNPSSMGTYGAASWPHMVIDTLNRTQQLNVTPIHYKGEAPMWVDTATGIVQGAVGSVPAIQNYMQRKDVRPIATVGARRTPRLPDLPTFIEQGFTDPVFSLEGWMPFCAPAGTPEDILQKVSDAFQEAYTTPKIRAAHENLGIPNGPTSLLESRKRWKDEAPQWIALAERLGVKLD